MRITYFLILFKILALLGGAGVAFASDLPACPSSGYLHNCFGTYTFDPNSKWAGNKYVGEFRDDTFHGQGTYTFVSGNKYVGEFRDGNRNGQGTYTLPDGDQYVGEYKDGERNGQGTYTWPDGDQYVGEYKDGKRNGQGTSHLHLATNTLVNTRDGKRNGQGTYTFADGRRDVGEFKDGGLNGYATRYRADGSILKEGVFKDDKFLYASKDPNKSDLPACPSSGYLHNCFGTYTFDTNSKWAGDKYVGEFRDNTFHGQGTYTFADGERYVGEFKDGKKHGKGIETFVGGDKYVGEYRDGKRNGQGTYYFLADNDFKGDKYVGEYKDGKRNGQGTYTFDKW